LEAKGKDLTVNDVSYTEGDDDEDEDEDDEESSGRASSHVELKAELRL